jgi:ABC-2 type transport system ATP-binding protein
VLGPNGAGKTTFVRAVATLLRPDAGTLRVAGIDVARRPDHVRQVIGLAGQHAAVEPTMTGRENLLMVARLFGQSSRQAAANAGEVMSRLGLQDVADRQVKTYSGGLQRRLDLGASLVGAPRLLLLDEPTTGLDPTSRIRLWEAIRELLTRGTDVLLTTQYLEEADQLAGQVVIIDHGRVIASGSPAELKTLAGSDMIEVRSRRAADVPALARALAAVGFGRAAHRRRHEPSDRSGGRRAVGRHGSRRGARRHRRRGRGSEPPPADARRGVPHPDRRAAAAGRGDRAA